MIREAVSKTLQLEKNRQFPLVKILTALIQQNPYSPKLTACTSGYPQTQVRGHVATCTYGIDKAERRGGGGGKNNLDVIQKFHSPTHQ